MTSRFLLSVLCALLLLPGCAARDAARKAEAEAHAGRVLTGKSWEVNKAVMQAGERSRSYDVAIAAGVEELDARPANDEARFLLARLQTRAGHPEQAVNTLGGLTARGKANPEYGLELARAYMRSGSSSQALEILEDVRGDAAVEREARKLRAAALALTRQYLESESLYKQLLAEREEPEVRYNYGRTLIASEHYLEAVSALLPLADSPDYPMARVLVAGAKVCLGDEAGCRALLEGYLTTQQINELIASMRPGSLSVTPTVYRGKKK